ncbi:SpoIIE family protein phosphatase [Nonomuraea sp. SYSU D8015]|uniref:SpoIIE family protein phosphatase n=1 Tax=Nonomuraea sp. SYSU D8015 TaxID=2593644 RepID=UPI001660FA5B|nr:SpoIIE family protein phosphatase [Nonomuraea sp. SYSU D8015]
MREETAPSPGTAIASSPLDDLLVETVVSTGAHIGAVYLLAEDGEVLLMDAQLGMPVPIAKMWARVRTNDPVPVAVAVRERRMVWLSGLEQMARAFPSAALALPYHFAVAIAPIRTGDAVWGGVVLLWPAGRTPMLSPRHRETLKAAGARMGEVLRRAADEGRPIAPGPQPRVLDPRPARPADPDAQLVALECLNRLPDGFCSLDVDGRVTLLSAPAADLLGSCSGELLGERLWEALPWLDDPVYEDRYRAAVVGRQVTSFTARTPAGRPLTFRLFPGLTGVTVRITPAAAGFDRAPGVPETGADRPTRVIALHEMLHLATTLARAVTAQEVLDLVADHVMPVYNVQALAILTSKDGRLQVAASRGYSRQAIDTFDGHPVITPSPRGHPFDSGRPAFFSTWEELHQAYPTAVRIDDMSALAFLPLVTSGRPIGTCILAYDRPHQFSTDERATLTALAGLIAQAFERARLYDVKHQLAQCLQSSLLPRTLPEVPGLDRAARYVPATPGMDIGGDFYDLIRLSDTMAAAVIGDVQGHDVTAAALMGQVRTAVRAHATAGATPGEVLTHTNRLLMELSPDRFTSCLYVSLDLERHTACLASAGHLPPLLGRPGEPAQVIDASPGLLLGIDPEAEYTTLDLDLPPGSVLTLYTDGLIERPGFDLDAAIADLADHFALCPGLSLPDLAESLIEPATLDQRTDDIAVLLLRDATRDLTPGG